MAKYVSCDRKILQIWTTVVEARGTCVADLTERKTYFHFMTNKMAFNFKRLICIDRSSQFGFVAFVMGFPSIYVQCELLNVHTM